MNRYYLNNNRQANGDQEVHASGCTWLPNENNRIYLGTFSHCSMAVLEAKRKYPLSKINGCYYCSRDCHTS